MKHLALIAIALFLVGCNNSRANHGAEHTVSFTHDGLFVDSYSIYCGQASGAYTQNTIISKDLRSYPVKQLNLPDGLNYCAMTANNFSGDSSFSNEIAFGIMDGDLIITPPSAPAAFSVQ